MSLIRVRVEGRSAVRRPANIPVGFVADRLSDDRGVPYIAALVNNDLVSLSYPLDVNSEVRFLTLAHSLGMRVYRNSLSFLLACCADELFPDARFSVEHSLGTGFFYTLETGARGMPTQLQVKQLERRMRDLVESDVLIKRSYISFAEAARFFTEAGKQDRVNLLRFRNPPKVVIYSCGKFRDLAHGPLAPRAGILNNFKLIHHPPGLVLQFPRPDRPSALPPFRPQPHLFRIFHDHKNWGRIVGVSNVGKLNELIISGDIDEFIRVEEAFHEKKIALIADSLLATKKRVKVILISGPSASGKTTFAKRLALQLRVNGVRPVMISLDNYFLNEAKTPRNESGRPDYEHIDALDVKLFNQHLLSLINGEEIKLPFFDFTLKRRVSRGEKIRIEPDQVLIVEGIHGLNPLLTDMLPAKLKFKIYVSALTQLNIDNANRISTTDNRLMRRLVRDYTFRGNSPLATLRMWPSVRRGEKRWIFPFQQHADAAFNSALSYELAVLKPLITPLLMEIKPQHREYAESRRLQEFLSNFLDASHRSVPHTSILREYIGSSDFKY